MKLHAQLQVYRSVHFRDIVRTDEFFPTPQKTTYHLITGTATQREWLQETAFGEDNEDYWTDLVSADNFYWKAYMKIKVFYVQILTQ
ncbi:hypothetical protein J6590_072170 [Homalodisca vitripennis]|nr:hypothetical protein J6590_072170 [Homalodisca vitripennis]